MKLNRIVLSLMTLMVMLSLGILVSNKTADSQTGSCKALFSRHYQKTYLNPYAEEVAVGKVVVQRGSDWTGWAEYSVAKDPDTQSVRGSFDTIYSSRRYPSSRGRGPFNMDWPSKTLLSLNLDGSMTYIEKYQQNAETKFTINPVCSAGFVEGDFEIRGVKSVILVSPAKYVFVPR